MNVFTKFKDLINMLKLKQKLGRKIQLFFDYLYVCLFSKYYIKLITNKKCTYFFFMQSTLILYTRLRRTKKKVQSCQSSITQLHISQ